MFPSSVPADSTVLVSPKGADSFHLPNTLQKETRIVRFYAIPFTCRLPGLLNLLPNVELGKEA